jgi:hypothetical protein
VQRALLLDVVVGQGAPVLQLFARKDQALLIGGDACGNRQAFVVAAGGLVGGGWRGAAMAGGGLVDSMTLMDTRSKMNDPMNMQCIAASPSS